MFHHLVVVLAGDETGPVAEGAVPAHQAIAVVHPRNDAAVGEASCDLAHSVGVGVRGRGGDERSLQEGVSLVCLEVGWLKYYRCCGLRTDEGEEGSHGGARCGWRLVRRAGKLQPLYCPRPTDFPPVGRGGRRRRAPRDHSLLADIYQVGTLALTAILDFSNLY